jgi:hypothetical protein
VAGFQRADQMVELQSLGVAERDGVQRGEGRVGRAPIGAVD